MYKSRDFPSPPQGSLTVCSSPYLETIHYASKEKTYPIVAYMHLGLTQLGVGPRSSISNAITGSFNEG